MFLSVLAAIMVAASSGLNAPAPAPNAAPPTQTTPTGAAPDFGSDSSRWANDGECDDPRFQGPGMTSTTLLDEDRFADATDCRNAFQAGKVQLRGDAQAQQGKTKTADRGPAPDFGNDSGEWANDGECDDPRFQGPGMTSTLLLDADRLADATDCSAAWERGQLSLR